MPNKHVDISDEIFIRKSREEVFRLLSDADFLVKWWSSECRSDPRKGGELVFTWENGTTLETVFDTFEMPASLGFDFYNERCEFTLEEQDGGCLVKVLHKNVAWSGEDISGALHVAKCWGTLLVSLKALAEHGVTVKG